MSQTTSIFKPIVLYVSALVTVSVISLGLWLYQALVVPLEPQFLGRVLSETYIDIDQRMHGKLEEGKAIATAIVGYQGIIEGLAEDNSEMVFEEASKIQPRFASLSKYQNILTKVINVDDEVVAVGWDKTKSGDLIASPKLAEMQKTKKVVGSYGVEEKGFGAFVYAPVYKEGEYVGAIQLFSGVGAVANDLKETSTGWVLLLDKQYLMERYKKIPASVANNQAVGNRYVVAHPKWFDSQLVDYVSQHIRNEIPDGYDIQIVDDNVIIDVPVYDDVYKTIGRHLIVKSAESLNKQIDEAELHVFAILLSVVFALIVIAFVIMWLVKQRAIVPMTNLVDTIEKVVHDSRFGLQMPVSKLDEVGRVYQAINHLLKNLNVAVTEIEHVVHSQADGDLTQKSVGNYHGQLKELQASINAAGEKLKDTVSQAVHVSYMVSEAAAQVSHGALDLSSRVQEQAAALEQTSATMTEMTAAVEANTDNANRVAGIATKVQGNASVGYEVMQQAINAMRAIQESSAKISDIVALIDGISMKTNMLALNASVEAARAGEHGRGFAVVASEVKTLALKSAEAAKDIKMLINDSVRRIERGTEYVDQSGIMFDDITQALEEVATMVKEIAYASNEQNISIGHIHKAIAEIDRITQENAALVEETTAAAENLSSEAEQLRGNMAYFKISKDGSDSAKEVAISSDAQARKSVQQASPPISKPIPHTRKIEKNEWAEF